jgi:hypothetical protein
LGLLFCTGYVIFRILGGYVICGAGGGYVICEASGCYEWLVVT